MVAGAAAVGNQLCRECTHMAVGPISRSCHTVGWWRFRTLDTAAGQAGHKLGMAAWWVCRKSGKVADRVGRRLVGR